MIIDQAEGGAVVPEGEHAAGEWKITAHIYLTEQELAAFDHWPTYADTCDPDRKHEPGGMCWCHRLHSALAAERLNGLEGRVVPAWPTYLPAKGELLSDINTDHERLRACWQLAHRWQEMATLSEDPNGTAAASCRAHAIMLASAVTGEPGDPVALGQVLAALAADRLAADRRADLQPLVDACRAAGWDPDTVAELFTGWLDHHGYDLAGDPYPVPEHTTGAFWDTPDTPDPPPWSG